MQLRAFAIGLVVCGVTTLAHAQAPTTEADRAAQALLAKGRNVTLKIPLNVLDIEGQSFAGVTILTGSPQLRPDGTASFPGKEWQTAGFPAMLEMKVEKIQRKKEHAEIELRSPYAYVKLRFPPDTDSLQLARGFSSLVTPGGATSEAALTYRAEAYRTLAKTIFVDKLAEIPPAAQATLVEFAHLTASGTSIRSQTYKDNFYLVVDLGRDTSVYNDLRFNQASVVAHILNEKLLKTLKAFAEPVKDLTLLHGLKLEFDIPHKSFLDEAAAPSVYKLQLFAPAALIRKFADADITSQEFVDGCVVIVDDNRVQIPLSASGK